MKNTIKSYGARSVLFRSIAFAAVIGISITVLSLTACDTGGGNTGGSGTVQARVAKYKSTEANGTTYILEIKEDLSGRAAAYTPRIGDAYVLTITYPDKRIMISEGTIDGKNGDALVLKPSNSDTTFAVTIIETKTAQLMKSITGTIALTEGEPISVTANVIPIQEYPAVNLWANKWKNDNDYTGENWYNCDLSLSDFTEKIPEKGVTFKFKISGTPDKPMDHFNFSLCCHNSDWSYYQGLAGAKEIKFTTTIKDEVFEITFPNDLVIPANANIFTLELSNSLWSKDKNGNYLYNYGAIPSSTPHLTTMATIKDFEISLVE